MSNVKKVILRENEEGNIYKLHPETDAEQVLMQDGENAETVLSKLKNKVVTGTYTVEINVPPKQPTLVTIPLNKKLETINHVVLAQARGTGVNLDWLCVTAAYVLNTENIQVSLLNHATSNTTESVIIDYALLEV